MGCCDYRLHVFETISRYTKFGKSHSGKIPICGWESSGELPLSNIFKAIEHCSCVTLYTSDAATFPCGAVGSGSASSSSTEIMQLWGRALHWKLVGTVASMKRFLSRKIMVASLWMCQLNLKMLGAKSCLMWVLERVGGIARNLSLYLFMSEELRVDLTPEFARKAEEWRVWTQIRCVKLSFQGFSMGRW